MRPTHPTQPEPIDERVAFRSILDKVLNGYTVESSIDYFFMQHYPYGQGSKEQEKEGEELRQKLLRVFKQRKSPLPTRKTEAAPPGWEKAVETMKRKRGINNPFAVAWSMHSRGIKPKK